MTITATPAIEQVQQIPVSLIEPNPLNRKNFNEAALAELADSISKTDGVIEPVILRPLQGGRYQIVAGERRWLASKKGKRETVKAIVKTLTEQQAIDILLIENDQREELPLMARCKLYKALLGKKDEKTGETITVKHIAARVSRSEKTIYPVLQADELLPEIKEALAAGKITDSHAVEICRLQPKEQEQTFLELFNDDRSELTGNATLAKVTKANVVANVSVKYLRRWISDNVTRDLSKAPFDPKDALLLKDVPACINCPKSTFGNPVLFADLVELAKGEARCTDGSCYDAKKQALVNIRAAEVARTAVKAPEQKHATKDNPVVATGIKPMPGLSQSAALAAAPPVKLPKVWKVSSLDHWEANRITKQPEVLYNKPSYEGPPAFRVATEKCEKPELAVYADGKQIGKQLAICRDTNCKKHDPYRESRSSFSRGSSGRSGVTFTRRVQIWNCRVQYVFRDALLKAIFEKAPAQPGEVELTVMARHIMEHLEHRMKLVFKRFGFKDSGKAAGRELLKLAIMASVTDEIGWEGMDQTQEDHLPKDSSLALLAKAYKVDAEKLLEEAKASLEKKRPKTDKEKTALAKAKTGIKSPEPAAADKKKKSKPAPAKKGKKK